MKIRKVVTICSKTVTVGYMIQLGQKLIFKIKTSQWEAHKINMIK